MAVQAFVGSFAKRSGTGTQAITGVGFTPKALIFWSAGCTATGFANQDYLHFHGFSDGTTHIGTSHLSQDAHADGIDSTAGGHRNDACLLIVDDTGAVDSLGTVASLDADGFTVNWSTAAGFASVLINYIAIGGDTVEAKVGDIATSGSTGAQTVTGVGFKPTALFCLSAAGSSAATYAGIGFGPMGFGWASRSAMGAAAVDTVHVIGNTDRRRYQRTTDLVAAKGAAGVAYEASLTSFNADGFTLNWSTARSARLPYLALNGCVASVGALTQPTSTGAQAVALTGINPVLVCLLSVNNIASTTNDTQNRFSFGASDGTHQRTTWVGDNHATFPTQTGVYQSSTSAIAMATPLSGSPASADAEGSLGSFTDGFTVTWSAADATARQVLYLALSPADGTAYTDGDPGTLASVTLTDRAGTAHPWAEVDLNDASTYYDGYKAPRILSQRSITRALSGAEGAFEHASFGVTLSDTDRSIRGLLDDATTKYLTNCSLVTRTFSDADRRAELPQHIEMAGYVSDYSPKEDFQFEFTGVDWLKKKLARRTQAPEYWQILLTRDDFPQLPDQLVNHAAPLVYGKVSDEVESVALGSIPADLYPRGGYDPGWITFGRRGWGSGSFSPGDVWLWVTGIKDGVESTITPGSTWFLMSVASPATQLVVRYGAALDTIRVYISDSSDFNPFTNPLAGTYARYVDFDPADYPEGNNPYASPDPADANNRFILIDSPTQGGDYQALVSDGSGGTISPAKGAWPTLYVGELYYGGTSVGSAFVVCFGAVTTIEGVFVGGERQTTLGSGTDLQCPFLEDYETVFGANYLTINGRRWTVVLASGDIAVNAINGTAPITVNVHGYETTGDTTGTLIESPVRIHQHFACNFLASDATVTGVWRTTTPTLETGAPIIDDDSYDTAQTALEARISGGYVSGGGISVGGAFESAIDVLASLQRDGDFDAGISRQGSLMVAVEPSAAPGSATELTDILDIVDRSFAARVELTQHFWNVIPFAHTQDYTGQTDTGWFLKGSVEDAASITNYDQERTAQEWPMRWLRSSTTQGSDTIIDVAQRARLRYRHPLRVCTLTVPYLIGADVELGDTLRLTHGEGIGASGWSDHDVRVTRIDTDLNRWVRTFECYDLQPIYDGLEDAVEPTDASTGLRKETITSLQDRVTDAQADVTTLQAEIVTIDATLTDLPKRGRVRAATTANITISTALNNGDTLDGVTLATGDLVLVKNQSAPAENGVYEVAATPARFSQFDAWDDYPGAIVTVQEGTANADTTWLCTSNTGGTLETTALAFSKFTQTLDAMVGDSGSGGTKGLVPAPASGDAAGLKFLKADGTWAVPAGTSSGASGGLAKLATQTASSSSSLEFTVDNTYAVHLLKLTNLIPSADGNYLIIEVSTDGGSSWSTTGYKRAGAVYGSGGVSALSTSSAAASVVVGGVVESTSTPGLCGSVEMHGLGSTATAKTFISGAGILASNDGDYYTFQLTSWWVSSTAVNKIRVRYDSGANIASGVARLYAYEN